MPWTEETPEYEGYVKFPRVTGGQFGCFLHFSPEYSVNMAYIVAVDYHPKQGHFLTLMNGDTVPMNAEMVMLWRKLTTMSPAEAEAQHRQALGLAVPSGSLLGG